MRRKKELTFVTTLYYVFCLETGVARRNLMFYENIKNLGAQVITHEAVPSSSKYNY